MGSQMEVLLTIYLQNSTLLIYLVIYNIYID